jgi:hypothetical protein
MHTLMRIISDTTLESSVESDRSLINIRNLILQVDSNDRFTNKVNLLSSESSPGIWSADQILALYVFYFP